MGRFNSERCRALVRRFVAAKVAVLSLDARIAIVKEAVGSLYAAKQRTVLALLGILIGIGSVIAMMSVGMIAKVETLKQFQELGTEILTVQQVQIYDAEGQRTKATIRLEDALALPAAVPAVAAAGPWLQSFGGFSYAGKRIGDGEVIGVTEIFADLSKLSLAQGRFISDLDFRRYFCVIGSRVAQAMRRAGAQAVVGETIKVNERLFTVIGVLKSVPSGGLRNFNPNIAVLVPIATARRTFRSPDIRQIIARMPPGVHYTTATSAIEAYFRGKSEDLRISVESAKQLIEQMDKQMQLFTLLLGTIGSISLIMGGAGVMNVMLASVSERHREIGIRRAMGARHRDIQNQFLVEAVVLSLVGGVFGVVLGVLASYVVCIVTGWTFLISLTAVSLGVGVASAVGVFFGFYPAYQAARLDPIAALRAP